MGGEGTAVADLLAAKTHMAVITADIFGLTRQELRLCRDLIVLGTEQNGMEKARCVQEWGASKVTTVS